VYIVQCDLSRVIVDVNRAPDDISKEYEMAAEGVTVHTTWDGKKVYKEEPSQEQIDVLIKKYHEPFHEKIDEIIPHVRFLIDGHSFLPVGPKLRGDSGNERPDINLGNVNYSSCTRKHTMFFRDRRRIPPFLVPGIQIEINQGLYIKENSFEPIEHKVEEFHELFATLVAEFTEKFCI